ncbi:MAG TPA: SUMF1/EgtB/PvdO family nonheme iron enzyme, partial [Candidatus Paceibacterota bacterium]|nr:SUMF1/EgtB/PvdO family nonheme iron enzyme [Candidatus Paceibacterota bacterium]
MFMQPHAVGMDRLDQGSAPRATRPRGTGRSHGWIHCGCWAAMGTLVVIVRRGLLLACVTGSVLAQSPPQMFLRIAGPAPSRIESESLHTGLLVCSNAVAGLAYRIQSRTDLGSGGAWGNVRVYHATALRVAVDLLAMDSALTTTRVPAGAFQMGDSLGDGFANENPAHTVSLGALEADRFEVYGALWSEVRAWALSRGYDFDGPGLAVDPLAPVTAVSWYDCVKWCNARSEKNGLVPA